MLTEFTAPEPAARPADRCPVCSSPGEVLYRDLYDPLYGVAGTWSLCQCSGAECGAAWLDPMPTAAEESSLYAIYYTHEGSRSSLTRRIYTAITTGYLARRLGYKATRFERVAGTVARIHPGGDDELAFRALHLPAPEPGARVLDVGCGSGSAVSRLSRLGWLAEGVDTDAAAVAVGRGAGRPLRVGTLKDVVASGQRYEAITLSHVIEHVDDPVSLLGTARCALVGGGLLVVLTPNLASLGHRKFGRAWLHLDPPRHHVILTRPSLQAAANAAGLDVLACRSSVRDARYAAAISREIARHGKALQGSTLRRELAGLAFQLAERRRLRTDADAGEELVLIARRPN